MRSLQRDKLLYHGSQFLWLWKIAGKSAANIKIQVEGNRFILLYRHRGNGRAEESMRITWTACNYGGKRPYFLCPSCDSRVAILYLIGRYFLCRRCHNLTYSSQNESEVDRLFRKVRKIRRRLGASMDLTQPILWKPKGMHQRTFDRLRHQASKDLAIAFEALSRKWQHDI